MEQKICKIAIESFLSAFFFVFACSVTASAAADTLGVQTFPEESQSLFKETKAPFIDRIAFRTNALDWLLTIPNVGFEMDLDGSEFNSMTLGISAKYNWNTTHMWRDTKSSYMSPIAFNLLDVRPEFRYYYRTRKAPARKPDKWNVESFLKDKKKPKTWRAHYVGAYVNYGTYTLKLGKKGRQGQVIGFGASAGYSIPMYEYRNSAIDVELGLSAGFQMCSKQFFAHNPDGYFYTEVLTNGNRKGREHLGLTPFPVVSDVRVAFVWRHKSIKDKVKEDVELNRVKRHFNTISGDYNYNDCTKESLDVMLENTITSIRDRRAIMENDSLYRSRFMEEVLRQEENLLSFVPMAFPGEFKEDPRVHQIVKEYENKLYKLIEKGKKNAIKAFDKAVAEEKAGKAKAAAQAAKEAAAAAKEAETPDAPKEEKPAKEKKVKEPKPTKEKNKDKDKEAEESEE